VAAPHKPLETNRFRGLICFKNLFPLPFGTNLAQILLDNHDQTGTLGIKADKGMTNGYDL
tara:strand:- start:1643 stop:1822 length:180 start_codon:yes stop_codon:yes gene_type:complete